MDDHKPYIGDAENVPEKEIVKRVRKVKEGADAPLTDQVYGVEAPKLIQDIDVLPESTGVIQGDMEPLERFINMYQPGELIMRLNFRKHLLAVLENWRLQHAGTK